MKILTIATGIEFPHATQALRARRRRCRLGQPKTLHDRDHLHNHRRAGAPSQARPAAGWIRGHWSIDNKVRWVRDITYNESGSQIRSGIGPQILAALPNGALHAAGITNIAAANRHHTHDSARPGPTRHLLAPLPGTVPGTGLCSRAGTACAARACQRAPRPLGSGSYRYRAEVLWPDRKRLWRLEAGIGAGLIASP